MIPKSALITDVETRKGQVTLTFLFVSQAVYTDFSNSIPAASYVKGR